MNIERGFKIGDLVWARMKRSIPWPGMVSEPSENMKRPKGKQHCIWFFGTNNFGWVEDYGMQPYEQYKVAVQAVYSRSAGFLNAVAAIEEYIASEEDGDDVDEEVKEQKTDAEYESINKDSGVAGETTSISVAETGIPKKVKKREVSTSTTGTKIQLGEIQRVTRSTMKKTLQDTVTASAARTTILDSSSRLNSPDSTPLNVGQKLRLRKENIIPSKMRFGFLGLGDMGSGMVKNLINSGHVVVVWDTIPEKSVCEGVVEKAFMICELTKAELFETYSSKAYKDFVEAGATQGMKPSDVIALTDITISCVPDLQTAKEMVLREDGVLQQINASKGYVMLMAGVNSVSSVDVAVAIRSKEGRFMEAKIQGSRIESEEGSLVILAAGDESLYDDCQSAFQAIGQADFFVGEVGSATNMNLVLQVIKGVCLGGLAEGMALADQANLNRKDVMEIFSLTPAGRFINGRSFAIHEPLEHLQKDLNLAITLADELDHQMRVATNANESYKRAVQLGHGGHDVSNIHIPFPF